MLAVVIKEPVNVVLVKDTYSGAVRATFHAALKDQTVGLAIHQVNTVILVAMVFGADTTTAHTPVHRVAKNVMYPQEVV